MKKRLLISISVITLVLFIPSMLFVQFYINSSSKNPYYKYRFESGPLYPRWPQSEEERLEFTKVCESRGGWVNKCGADPKGSTNMACYWTCVSGN